MEITDKRLEELIADLRIIEHHYKGGQQGIGPRLEYISAFEELLQLRKEFIESHGHYGRLIKEKAELEKQNKLLIADGEKLAKGYGEMLRYINHDGAWMDRLRSILKQHKALMESIEEKI